jgi:hypothetical protein
VASSTQKPTSQITISVTITALPLRFPSSLPAPRPEIVVGSDEVGLHPSM